MDAVDRLDWLTRAHRVGQIIHAAAVLGVCDALAAEPLAAPQVAARVGAAEDPMRRLLRALVAIDVLRTSNGLFRNGPMGELLCADHPEEMRDVTISRMRDPWWRAWGALAEAVRSGRSAYEEANGRSLWDDLAEDAEAAKTFNALMSSGTAEYAASLVASLDLSGVQRVVDVGGGKGTMVAALLREAPEARGTVLDLPAGLLGAEELLAEAGVSDRVELVPGDFFALPSLEGDLFLLRRVLHDWPDDRALAILASCRRAIGHQPARLLVADVVMPEEPVPGPAEDDEAFTLDMHMLVLFMARERSLGEMEALLRETGFQVDEVLDTTPEGTVVARPV